MTKPPFVIPIRAEGSAPTLLIGADHEIIAEVWSVTSPEIEYLVRCVNAGARSIEREERL